MSTVYEQEVINELNINETTIDGVFGVLQICWHLQVNNNFLGIYLVSSDASRALEIGPVLVVVLVSGERSM